MKTRDLQIDVIRGLAICSMLIANSAPYFLQTPHPYWFRLLGSFAAPVFISIAGYLLGKSAVYGFNSWKKTIFRGVLTLFIAALIDLFIWNSMPFTSYDVLYVIGFGICLAPMYLKLSKGIHLLLSLVILIIPQMVFFTHYRLGISDYKLSETSVTAIFESFQAFFLDGWFPVFPWLGLIMLAAWVGKYMPEYKNQKKVGVVLFWSLNFIGGVSMMYLQEKATRNGYSELFYPPDIIYIVTAISFVSILWISIHFFNRKWLTPLSWLGRSSLFFYVLHSVFIVYILPFIFPSFEKNYGLLILFFFGCLLSIGFLLIQLKKKAFWNKMPMPLKYFLGN